MEPVTHFLTGAVLARTGFNRQAAYATAAMTLAAEFPDIDVLWSAGGPLLNFEHHRGLTHTFLGIPFEAALITAAFWTVHRIRRHRPPQPRAEAPALPPAAPPVSPPVSWPLLFAFTLLALLSHLFLDWTNNYGVRPFFPFNPRWYAGSFVFIFEPVLFALLLLALVAPLLFGLINAEVGARKSPFPGRGWAIFSLLAIAALWAFRASQHAKALELAAGNPPLPLQQAAQQADSQPLPPTAGARLFASPYPLNPFRWHIVLDTPGFLQLATLDTRTGTFAPPQPSDTLYKPPTSLPLLAAKRSDLGRIYLDWSQFPVLAESADTSDPAHPLSIVTFSDARFLYNTFLLDARTHSPLSASVTLDMQAPEAERVVATTMNGRTQEVVTVHVYQNKP